MLVADFGKHEDNWKWAGLSRPTAAPLYRPIPRDRDQSFTLWNGLLTYLANREWAVPSIEDFGEDFDGLEKPELARPPPRPVPAAEPQPRAVAGGRQVPASPPHARGH